MTGQGHTLSSLKAGKAASSSGANVKPAVRIAQLAMAIAYPRPRCKRLSSGVKLLIDPARRWIDFNLAVRSHYEQGTIYLVERLLPEKGVFIDVGANIGVISAHAARRVGKEGVVYAFEPDNINFSRLIWAREENELAQMVPLPLALGDERKLTALKRAVGGDGGLSSLADIDGFETHGHVPVTRLDDFIDCVPMDSLDMIKIDVEGFEKNVILGAQTCLSKHKPAVIMEMVNADAIEAGQVLVGLGYVSFLAGDKSDAEIKTLRAAPPQQLVHNNMLFVHASRTAALSSLGFEIA